MFESDLYSLLVNDSELANLLSAFNQYPAVFSDVAPQEATEIYIVFDIQEDPSIGQIIDAFTINFDIYNDTNSNEITRQIIERLTFLLDPISIETLRYKTVRFYRGSGGYIKDNDTEIKHYNKQFFARGTRKKWIDQL